MTDGFFVQVRPVKLLYKAMIPFFKGLICLPEPLCMFAQFVLLSLFVYTPALWCSISCDHSWIRRQADLLSVSSKAVNEDFNMAYPHTIRSRVTDLPSGVWLYMVVTREIHQIFLQIYLLFSHRKVMLNYKGHPSRDSSAGLNQCSHASVMMKYLDVSGSMSTQDECFTSEDTSFRTHSNCWLFE